MQMTSQDHVEFVVGGLVRYESGVWHFELDIFAGNVFLHLLTTMRYTDLVREVREKLRVIASDITVKLAYQYPLWMDIYVGDCSTPQYITDDHEVELFVQMQRKIEKVNLCVTVVKQLNTIAGTRRSSLAESAFDDGNRQRRWKFR